MTTVRKTISLPEGVLTYTLERQQRKTICIYLKPEGVLVRVPYRVTEQCIDDFLHKKSSWIWRKRQEQTGCKRDAAFIRWENGGTFSYMGKELTLKFCSEKVGVHLQNDVLEVGFALPPGYRKALEPKVLVQRWMQQRARVLFGQRCEKYASLLGVELKKLALTSAHTRWGSANARGYIRLHWRLLHLPLEVIDYVVVHELSHLKEMNHRFGFWMWVESILPDYKSRRSQLKSVRLPAW